MRRLFPTSRLSLALALSAIAAACGGSPSTGAPCPPSGAMPSATATPVAAREWLVENFEVPAGLSGGFQTVFDTNGHGTQMLPAPFKTEAGGAPASPGAAAHVWGTLGPNRAPWSWAQLQVALSPGYGARDIGGYRTLRFFAKGNGGRYTVMLPKRAITDFDHYRYDFVAPAAWTEIVVPLKAFAQAGWGKKVAQSYEDVSFIQFQAAEFEKPFDLWIDEVRLSPEEVEVRPFEYDTRGWFSYRGTDVVKRRGTALDVSRWLDAPAGKYGPVVRKGEDFAFRNGKVTRFFGINVVASANFPSHAEAERIAELLAQMGVNLTRHHHMDAPWARPNLFGNRDTTTALDAEALDRFDYFIAELQKRGIYQYIDLLVHRQASAADGVSPLEDVVNGYKIEGEFAPKLVELQERFIEQLMGHVNPYTKKAYAKNPAVALVEVINEDSLLWIQREGDFAVTTAPYRAELSRLFSAWLTAKVPGGRAALEVRWKADGSGGRGLGPDEDPARGNVDALAAAGGDYKPLSRARAADTFRFLYDTQLGYYRRIERLLRKLGYAGLVAGSNHWVEHVADLHANAELDFVDRHAYWAHPNGGYGYSEGISWDPGAMVQDPNLGMIGQFGRRRVKGLPYAASEWQTSAPNDYRAEGLPLMAAYSALHGTSPMQFAFSHDVAKRAEAPSRLDSNFDVIDQPHLLATWPAAALLFHRRDVKDSPLDAALQVDEKDVFDPAFVPQFPSQLASIAKTGVAFAGGKTKAELDALRARHVEGSRVRSVTGELVHDASAGSVTIDTARSQGFVGFRPAAPVALTNLRVELTTPFAVVLVTSLENEPLARAKRILVTAVGNAVNTGQKLEASRTKLRSAGSAPILVEPVVARLALGGLEGALDRTVVYALGPSGERGARLAAKVEGTTLTIELGPASQALNYEIVRSASAAPGAVTPPRDSARTPK